MTKILNLKRFLIYQIFLLSGALIVFSGCKDGLFGGEDDEKPQREWTIIGYFDGNNSLDNGQLGTSYLIKDLQEMETVGSTDEVTSIVMLANKKTGGNAAYYQIEKHSNPMPDEIKSKVLKDVGTKDMSDPQTLKEFMNYVVEEFPAKRYALIIDSHGGAWKGICPDEVNGVGDLMEIPSLKSALNASPQLDLLVFHSCLMGSVEVAYELRNSAKYMVASEINMPVLSILGADEWLADLAEDPRMETFDFAKRVAQCVYDRGNLAQRNTHMAVIDLTKMDGLASKVSDLSNLLVSEGGQYWNEIISSWAKTHYVAENFASLTDIREFTKQLSQQENLSKINLISNATNKLMTAFNEAIPFTKTNFTQKPCGGLSIHFPGNDTDFEEQSYSKLEFTKTNWSSFLTEFISKVELLTSKPDEAKVSGKVSWQGHTISNYCNLLVCYEIDGELEILGKAAVSTAGLYNFTISNITQPLDYMLYVHDDQNNNGAYDSGDGTGFWDPNSDKEWTFDDVITLEGGKSYSNINIGLSLEKSANIQTFQLINLLNKIDIKKLKRLN